MSEASGATNDTKSLPVPQQTPRQNSSQGDDNINMCKLPLHNRNEPEDSNVDQFMVDGGNKGGGNKDANPEDCIGDGNVQTGKHYVAQVTISVLTFWFFVSLIPLYNKHFFDKRYYPYPIATAGIQTGLVGVFLVIFNAGHHSIANCWNDNNHGDQISNDRSQSRRATAPSSWVFGPHLLWKVKVCFPVGFLFGLKYGVTNLGLKMVPTPIHLLLQSTDLIWTVLWASLINKERVSRFGLTCLAGCVLGTVILSNQVMHSDSEAPFIAIAFNLISPVLLGLVLATLRSACVELRREDNRIGGTASSVEITAIKLLLASATALTLATVFEGDWRATFRALPSSTKLGVLGSSVPILFYQVNCTYLTALTSAVTVGFVGQLKVIPQWATALVFTPDQSFVLGSGDSVGSLVTLASTAAYAVHNWIDFVRTSKKQRAREEEGWVASNTDVVIVDVHEKDGIGDIVLRDETTSLLENAAPATSTLAPSSGYHTLGVA